MSKKKKPELGYVDGALDWLGEKAQTKFKHDTSLPTPEKSPETARSRRQSRRSRSNVLATPLALP